MGKALGIGLPLAVIAGLILTLLLVLTPASQPPCSVAAASTVDPNNLLVDEFDGYDQEQLKNAAYIMNAAQALGLNHDAQLVGVMAALGESALRIPTYDDPETAPDTRGLFNQPSSGWGSLADRENPTISATNFFNALVAVDGWENLYPTIAAHRATGNADPYLYSPFQVTAETMMNAISGQNGTCLAGDLVLPLKSGYNMTDDFGPRTAPSTLSSTWHPADDLQNPAVPCGDNIYAITAGTVTVASGYQISVKHPDGYTVTYMHMYEDDMLVAVGDEIAPNQDLAVTGDNGPATGCHLDLRINMVGNVNPKLAVLPLSDTIVGGSSYPGFVDPEGFYALFGKELCPSDSCSRLYR